MWIYLVDSILGYINASVQGDQRVSTPIDSKNKLCMLATGSKTDIQLRLIIYDTTYDHNIALLNQAFVRLSNTSMVVASFPVLSSSFSLNRSVSFINRNEFEHATKSTRV